MALTDTDKLELLQLLEAEERSNARAKHLDFMEYTWRGGVQDQFVVGFHTEKICARLDKAFEDFRNGKSTYLLVAVHPRAGKSAIVSRYLGPHFLGEFPACEVMQVTYQATLAASFSSDARNIFRSRKYKELYPSIGLSTETNQKANWTITDLAGKPTGGKLYAAGLQSGLTGNGFHLGVLDDYFSGRAEAESKVQRDNAWDAFASDFMTRAAPVHIIIVLATQWHVDDINGRIRREMANNPNFPQFETLSFPARAKDYRGPGKYPSEFLFEERYPRTWYLTQYATLGKYSAASLFDCDPTIRSGGRFPVEGIDWYTQPLGLTEKKWIRVWDLAHTAKARAGDDPDWTSGTRLAFELRPGDPVPHLWVDDVARIRENATARDADIQRTADADGVYVRQYVEVSQDSKDAYEYLTRMMPAISWNPVSLVGKGDKGTRATPLEKIFEAPGHVHVRKAPWNDAWIDELLAFDGLGKGHDDQVDNLSAGYIVQGPGASLDLSAEDRAALAARRR